jgi:hypothetical protein
MNQPPSIVDSLLCWHREHVPCVSVSFRYRVSCVTPLLFFSEQLVTGSQRSRVHVCHKCMPTNLLKSIQVPPNGSVSKITGETSNSNRQHHC